jgi:cytochrome c oxidase assembly protein subunit 15
MKTDRSALWFRQLTLIACILALCVVGLGAYVRLSDAGLGCPDWPGCFGSMTVPQSEAAILQAQTVYPDSVLEVHKAWKEMLHRYLAGTLGLFILGLFVLGWHARRVIRVSPWLTTLLLLVVIFQAALGMWTVTMLLKPAIVSAHLLGGMSTLALLVWIAHRHWGVASRRFLPDAHLRLWLRGALLLIFAQIFLGGWTSSNYAALACTDFPTCHGVLIPDMDFSAAFHMVRELGQGPNGAPLELSALVAIQWVHRIGAAVVLLYLGVLSWKLAKYQQLKPFAQLLVFLLIMQIAIGIGNLVLHLPLVLAVAHNLGAALLLITIVILNSKITELSK